MVSLGLAGALLPQADDDGLLDVVGQGCGSPATSLSNRMTNQTAVFSDDFLNGGLVGTDTWEILNRDGPGFIHRRISW